MTRQPLDVVRLAAILLVAVAAISSVWLTATDQPAFVVGAVFLTLVVASGLAGLYRYGDVVAALAGSAAYVSLEQHRGNEGVLAWLAATVCFACAVAAVRFFNLHARAAEQRVQRASEVIEGMTMIDAASGLLNAYYGERMLEEEVSRARRTNSTLTLVLVARDPINEHAVDRPPNEAEEARQVGAAMRAHLRSTDRGARLAPAQFAAILPATSADGGSVVAKKLSATVDRQSGHHMRCVVATFPDHAVSGEDLLEEARAALRLARAADLPVITPTMLQRFNVAT